MRGYHDLSFVTQVWWDFEKVSQASSTKCLLIYSATVLLPSCHVIWIKYVKLWNITTICIVTSSKYCARPNTNDDDIHDDNNNKIKVMIKNKNYENKNYDDNK